MAEKIKNCFMEIYRAVKYGRVISLGIMSTALGFVPESMFTICRTNQSIPECGCILIGRIILCAAIFIIITGCSFLHLKRREAVKLEGRDYIIVVEYGDIINDCRGKRLITFDECFTTKVGIKPQDINPNSICGQYLKTHPIEDMKKLISMAGITPASGKSRFNDQVSYEPGTVLLENKDLLAAFAKLDENGKGYLMYDEYLACLNKLWHEIFNYYGQEDVYIPILGAGTTFFPDDCFIQQELLDILIRSYKLSKYKLKKPYKLHIVCRREDISLNEIEGVR